MRLCLIIGDQFTAHHGRTVRPARVPIESVIELINIYGLSLIIDSNVAAIIIITHQSEKCQKYCFTKEFCKLFIIC